MPPQDWSQQKIKQIITLSYYAKENFFIIVNRTHFLGGDSGFWIFYSFPGKWFEVCKMEH